MTSKMIAGLIVVSGLIGFVVISIICMIYAGIGRRRDKANEYRCVICGGLDGTTMIGTFSEDVAYHKDCFERAMRDPSSLDLDTLSRVRWVGEEIAYRQAMRRYEEERIDILSRGGPSIVKDRGVPTTRHNIDVTIYNGSSDADWDYY